jgi:hypothetical protein
MRRATSEKQPLKYSMHRIDSRTRLLSLLCLCTSLTTASVAAAQTFELGVREVPAGSFTGVGVLYPAGGGTNFSLTHRTNEQFLLAIPLQGQERWVTDVDVAAHTSEGTRPVFLRLRAQHAGARDQISIYSDAPALSIRQIDDVDRLIIQADEESLLRAYFRARGGCLHWRVANPRHIAAIRSCRKWFDASYQLAIKSGRPYRMDRGARDVMDAYEREIAFDEALRRNYRLVVRPGYVTGLTNELDALAFGDASLVRRFIDEGHLQLARLVNDHLLSRWGALDADLRRNVVAIQAIDAHVLEANKAYINTLMAQSRFDR